MSPPPDCPATALDWSVAVFARNVATTLKPCLDSIAENCVGHPAAVHVLVNGSTDATEARAREFASVHAETRVHVLALGDKANAWNLYTHRFAEPATVHFYVDGDGLVSPGAFAQLANTLAEDRRRRAVGALPGTGRDRVGVSYRMQACGRVSGNLYALGGGFVADLRARHLQMPVGLVGEDFLVSCLAKDTPSIAGLCTPSPRLVIHPRATFVFRSLSPWRASDWWTYGRRLVRYQLRGYQFVLLFDQLGPDGFEAMPTHVDDLYRKARWLPRYTWRGWLTPFDALAVRQIRRGAHPRGPSEGT